MDILERVISGPDSDGANSIIADSDPLQEETQQVLSLCSSVLTQFHPLGRDLRLVITFSRCGDKLQECMEEVTGIAKHAKASIRHQESLSPDIVLPLLEMAVETPPGVWKRRMWTPPGKYACATKNWTKPIAKRWPFWSAPNGREPLPSTSIFSSLSVLWNVSETLPKPSPPPSSS